MENEKPLVPRGRFRRFFNHTAKVERSMYIKHFGDSISDGAQKTLRMPLLLDSASESTEIISNIYPSPSDNPIQYLLLVGSFAGESIDHMKDYKFVKENIDKISEIEYDSRLKDSLRGYKDIDLFLIHKETSPKIKFSATSILKSLLPMPTSIEGLIDGWDLHDESIRTVEQILGGFKSVETRQTTLLNKHELQVLEKNPMKNIKPVILWENENVRPELKEKIEGSVKTCCLRHMSDYLSQTWIPYAREFREEFPKVYEEIVNDIVEELNTGQYRVLHPETQKQLLNKLVI